MRIELGDAVVRLARGAAVVRELALGVGGEQARWRPAPGKWALTEVVHHLADEEVLDFPRRLRSVLEDPRAEWPPIDPEGWCRERKYIEGRIEDASARFQREREQSLAWLCELGSIDADLAHDHPRLGRLRAGDLLAAWIDHDLLHARQMLALHHAWHAERSNPYSTAYAGPW